MSHNQDGEWIRFEGESGPSDAAGQVTWMGLVVDDDAQARKAAVWALDGKKAPGGLISVGEAASAKEAKEWLIRHPKTAFAVIDLAMETPDAGLKLVEWIRSQPQLEDLRVALRSGSMGSRTADELALEYDVSDCRNKESLDRPGLMALAMALVRAYQSLRAAREGASSMRELARAAQRLSEAGDVAEFKKRLEQALAALLGAGVGNIHIEGRDPEPNPIAKLDHECWLTKELVAEGLPKTIVKAKVCESELGWAREGFAALMEAAKSAWMGLARLERLRELAFTDPATGLPNRRALMQWLEAAEKENRACAALALDVDDFKKVNDKWGHEAGDRMLGAIGARLGAELERQNLGRVARVGGDEFCAVIYAQNQQEAIERAKNLIKTASEPLDVGLTDRIEPRMTGGLAWDQSILPGELIRAADMAMYKAKAMGGKGRFMVWQSDQSEKERKARADRLLKALEVGELELHYQPKVSLRDGSLDGFEALVRWAHPQRGILSPADFLPLAQEMDLMDKLDLSSAKRARSDVAWWASQGLRTSVQINLAPEHLQNKVFLEGLRAALSLRAGEEGRVGVEIVESAALGDIGAAMRTVEDLRLSGIAVSLDDFGTGYSSLSHLQKLPLDELKIDQSFVKDMMGAPSDRQIVMSMAQLAKVFGMRTVAEGVETAPVALQLKDIGVDSIQGYGIARPMSREKALEWALRWNQGERPEGFEWLRSPAKNDEPA